MDLWGSSNLGGGGSSTATLPDQISNLACTGGTDGSHGTIDVSFTEVPATSFDLLKYYILIYKTGGIPQTPFDGTRITLPKGTAGAKLEHQITGLTFDQLYGIRIYPVSVKNQFQTLAEGATATATPVAGIRLGDLMADVEVDRIKGIENDPEVQFLVLKHNYNDSGGTLVIRSKEYKAGEFSDSPYVSYPISTIQLDFDTTYFKNYIKTNIQPKVLSNVKLPYFYTDYTIRNINSGVFPLAVAEVGFTSDFLNQEGSTLPYFINKNNRGLASGLGWWTRSYFGNESVRRVYITSLGAFQSAHPGETYGYRPAFCLPADMLFNPEPDADGCYVPI